MITQVKDFISTIVADVRTSTYVQGKVDSGKWLSGAPYYYHGTPIEINNIPVSYTHLTLPTKRIV